MLTENVILLLVSLHHLAETHMCVMKYARRQHKPFIND